MEINSLTIKDFRDKLGESQSELAEKLGITLRTYQNYEAGKEIPPSTKKLIRYVIDSYKEDFALLDEKQKQGNNHSKLVKNDVINDESHECLTKYKNTTLPGIKCTNPECLEKIDNFQNEIAYLKEINKLLNEKIDRLQSGEGAAPPEKSGLGSVDKPGGSEREAV